VLSHLDQGVGQHVTLELVGGANGLYGWVRILPDGGIEAGPLGTWVVPERAHLVITDVDWQWNDHGTGNAGVAVTLRLFVVSPTSPDSRRLLDSIIVLSSAGQGGTTTNWTAGGVFGPFARIGIDTIPFSAEGHLQYALLHGYLIGTEFR
jgi:hypothetical protein